MGGNIWLSDNMTNNTPDHPLVELVKFHELSAQQICLALCDEFLPQDIRNNPEISDHIQVERMLAKRLFKTAGIARILLQRILEIEKMAKEIGLDHKFMAILNNPELKKHITKVIGESESYK